MKILQCDTQGNLNYMMTHVLNSWRKRVNGTFIGTSDKARVHQNPEAQKSPKEIRSVASGDHSLKAMDILSQNSKFSI